MTRPTDARMAVTDDVLPGGRDLPHTVRIAHGIHRPATGDCDEPVVPVHGTPSTSVIRREIVPLLVAAGHILHASDLSR